MDRPYDREPEDLGNVVALEHVNVLIPDQQLATLFYVTGLGLTRDPFLNTGAGNMWINVGVSQFHLPNGEPQVLRGAIGLVNSDRAALLERLNEVKKPLAGTKFSFRETNDGVETVCPWGNRITCHEPPQSAQCRWRAAPSASEAERREPIQGPPAQNGHMRSAGARSGRTPAVASDCA